MYAIMQILVNFFYNASLTFVVEFSVTEHFWNYPGPHLLQFIHLDDLKF